MTQREDFETWYVKAYHVDGLINRKDGCYMYIPAGMAWDAWQAAQAWNPSTNQMTADRVTYFMRRFKHEEKLLGPN